MHAYLITGNNEELIREKISSLIESLKVKRLGFSLQKIADVKELSKFTNLSLNEGSAVVIENFDSASTDAQNAFLKNLEEPQENLIYILTAKNADSVLPTISSRCQLIETSQKTKDLSNENKEKISKFIKSSVGEKLKETSKISKREDAIQLVQDLLTYLHSEFKNDSSLVQSIEVADQTLRNLDRNGNVQIQLTNLVVNL